MSELDTEISYIFQAFTGGKKYFFGNLVPSMLEDRLAVVYAIFNVNTGEALYVGRTKNLRQRLYTNHLMGPKSNARLKKYLVEDDNESKVTTMEEAKVFLKENCYFQYLEEPDMRKRGRLEGLLSYLLGVRYIHEEH
ncbi:GIY-YIG nuclease family protein [Paludicola sp. MB14-C6]|uniref:GIY-YIG nuclease family protein n=1 Tax=Paludihabitans sp. MB14-C6 TaxID=3070656 RepID=UPI0027DDBA5C|nr:GIY-YIG nuclease family protein [Paludicola sp. MB14-C6]WMJ22425.1 GIY-YIG nuclease family protein [Paludicola sp. MB14-C6]